MLSGESVDDYRIVLDDGTNQAVFVKFQVIAPIWPCNWVYFTFKGQFSLLLAEAGRYADIEAEVYPDRAI
jgi:hypothetical protein